MSLTKVVSTYLCILMVLIPFLDSVGANDQEETYVCPMNCENIEYDQPGQCPVCGMDLVKKQALEQGTARKKVAILVFDGVQIIDYSAPYEVFGQAGFDVFTVSPEAGTITTSMNMNVNPTYHFENSPPPDILLIPGGEIHKVVKNPEVLQWIQKNAQQAEYVLSVCNGAFFLAEAGLLDGLSATTFYGMIQDLAEAAPKTKVVRDQRYVDNGKIITSAGLSSGIDAAIYLVSKIKGEGEAEHLALHMEYNWNRKSDYARAALADQHLPNLDLPDDSQWKYLHYAGDTEHWELKGSLKTATSLTDLVSFLRSQLSSQKWSEVRSTGSQGTAQSKWSFRDLQNDKWDATIEMEEAQPNHFNVTIRLRKTDAALAGN